MGKAILEKYFKEEGFDYKEDEVAKILKKFSKKTISDLYADVGEGLITRNNVLNAVHPEYLEQKKKKKSFSFFKRGGKEKKEEIQIRGLIPGMAVHFAGCCHPLPGDKIIGIITTGKGVTIHTNDCETLENFVDTPERWVEVGWDTTGDGEMHTGRLKVILSHETGALAELTNIIAKDLGNIMNLKITNRSTDFFEIIVDIGVKNLRHLNDIINSLRAKASVHSVERSTV